MTTQKPKLKPQLKSSNTLIAVTETQQPKKSTFKEMDRTPTSHLQVDLYKQTLQSALELADKIDWS